MAPTNSLTPQGAATHTAIAVEPAGRKARAAAVLLAVSALCIAVFPYPCRLMAGDPPAHILPIWQQVFARPSNRTAEIPAPPGNPLTAEKIALGKRLFFDSRLSTDAQRSCASCHAPQRAFTDGRQRAKALDGSDVLRNTPTLYDLAWAQTLFWDGRSPSLEDQARHPIDSISEMNGDWRSIETLLGDDPDLVTAFAKAFPLNPTIEQDTVLAALASYQRSLTSPISDFDRFIAGEDTALSKAAARGFSLFVGKAGCISCHSGWRFTDGKRHRIASDAQGEFPDGVKTPSLRNLELTAPFMHDGSKASLAEVLDHYIDLPPLEPTLSPNLVRPLRLSPTEKSELISFLRVL